MQSDDLGLVPVAWIVHDDPELGDYLTRSKTAAEASGRAVSPLYDAAAIERLVAERDEAAKTRDAGREVWLILQQSMDTVVKRLDAVEAQRDKLKEALARMVQRFELHAGPNDMHAGHHDLALLSRARKALGDTL